MTENEILEILGRKRSLFAKDFEDSKKEIKSRLAGSSVLVVGGAGTIGTAIIEELVKLDCCEIHVVDISENGLAELVRSIRNSKGTSRIKFATFAIDITSSVFSRFLMEMPKYDFVFNLSAMKHVRSERDPYTLLRMFDVNITSCIRMAEIIQSKGTKNVFMVSTDKATNPTNIMGATKRIMEISLFGFFPDLKVSSARFANVAFSDGSLLNSFTHRIAKQQPIAAPSDIQRYFITKREAGQLSLIAAVLGENRQIFCPKTSDELKLTSLTDVATRFVKFKGYKPKQFNMPSDAIFDFDLDKNFWPCIFEKSDTDGEKHIEEFFQPDDHLEPSQYEDIAVVREHGDIDLKGLKEFHQKLLKRSKQPGIEKEGLTSLIKPVVPNFTHISKGKSLDQKL